MTTEELVAWWLAHPWADVVLAVTVSAFVLAVTCLLTILQELVFDLFYK